MSENVKLNPKPSTAPQKRVRIVIETNINADVYNDDFLSGFKEELEIWGYHRPKVISVDDIPSDI